ncbi:MAG TPA: dihydrodipicolinate synthase family protein [Gemmatimonadaceae bacterium]|nr:dihydrodipicolinate synthase family protein [Gemmatimonadaceae bacterium]
MVASEIERLRAHLLDGQVIPAHPLALDRNRKLDERHQRALTRYYVASGAGGVAVGVHTTQFEIRDPRHGLLAPVLELAAETTDAAREAMSASDTRGSAGEFTLMAGVCGPTAQAVREASLARDLGYDAGLLSLAGWNDASDAELLEHCREVASVIPIVGFYLQPAVGGRELGYDFWRELAEIHELVAIKIAPFDRYRTIDVVRAIADSGRRDVALYTGNDDNIVLDLLSRFPTAAAHSAPARPREEIEGVIALHPDRPLGFAPRIVGGLLGHWAFWTRRAVQLLRDISLVRDDDAIAATWLTRAAQVTDANGAIFDARNRFAGCIPGIHEILRRQGLLAGNWCLDPREALSPGQIEEMDRVRAAYPWMNDDDFVAERLDDWLR